VASTLTADHIVAIYPDPNSVTKEQAEVYLPYLVAACKEFEITTKLRVAGFLSQLGAESGELIYWEELADGWAYEWREDLGNVYEGDGPKYKGHGPIQITGRGNHGACGEYLGLDLINNPTLIGGPHPLSTEQIQHGFRAAGWYWKIRGNDWRGLYGWPCDLNLYADQGDIDAMCYGVNGGWNGYDHRVWYYNKALEVLPDDLDLSESLEEEEAPEVTEEPEVAKDGLVYTDDNAYIRARENDAYVWVLQGANTPAKANRNGYIWVPDLPGGGPVSLAALPPTRADTLVTAADSDTWLRPASGSYIQGKGIADHDLQVNQNGWLWDRTAWEAKPEEVTEEPEVAKDVLVYADDDVYIRARENDAYVWMLQGSNTPAKADGNGYIWVPGLPGAGPDAAALSPTKADKLVTAADSDTWLRTALGSYIQGKGMSDHDLQVNQSGWLWDRTAWEAKAGDDWDWPVADTPADETSWSYVARHPTRYNWVPSVEKVARDLINNFSVWCNTYVGHPPPEIVGGVWYDRFSMDVWNPGGRGDTLDWNLHTQVCDYVMNDPNPPMLAWVCSKYYLWTPSAGWQWYSNDTDPATDYAHVYHLHLTFALTSE